MAGWDKALSDFAKGAVPIDDLMAQFDKQVADEPERAGQMRAELEALKQLTVLSADDEKTICVRLSQSDATAVVSEATNADHTLPFDTSQQEQLVPGTVLNDRFVLEEVIGVGGMSLVFKALDLRKQEAQDEMLYVAMKVLGADFKSHPDSFRVLQQEARKAQSLAHPNIVTVYDFDRDGNTIFMTMECLVGETLNKLIASAPLGMPLKKALFFVEGMVQALGYAHKKNIIHSDLKPGNVFYTEDKTVKLLDFGIARAGKAAGHADGAEGFDPSAIGALTPAYASCEMLEDKAPDPRDDIYGLACITYELLTGKHPFNKKSAIEARDAELEPERVKGLTHRQWAGLKRGLQFDRAARTASANQFFADVSPRPLIGKRTAWLLALLVVVSGYYVYDLNRLKTEIDEKLITSAPVVLTSEDTQKIKEYYEAADLYLALGYLAVPPGDNAYDAYQKILDIDPRNKKAREGIRNIADRYEQLARDALRAGALKQSQVNVDLGLRVHPSHDGLLELRRKLEVDD